MEKRFHIKYTKKYEEPRVTIERKAAWNSPDHPKCRVTKDKDEKPMITYWDREKNGYRRATVGNQRPVSYSVKRGDTEIPEELSSTTITRRGRQTRMPIRYSDGWDRRSRR